MVARHRNAKGAFEVEEKGWLRSRFDVSTGFSLPLTNNRDGRNEKNARRVVHFPPRIRTRVSRSIANGDKFIHDSKKKRSGGRFGDKSNRTIVLFLFIFYFSFFFLDLDRTTFFTHELLVTR